MKKTIKLTIETERVLLISRGGAARQAQCATCGAMVNFVTVDEAAALMRTGQRTIYRMVEAEQLHFTETVEDLLICFDSLGGSQLAAETYRFTNNSKMGREKP